MDILTDLHELSTSAIAPLPSFPTIPSQIMDEIAGACTAITLVMATITFFYGQLNDQQAIWLNTQTHVGTSGSRAMRTAIREVHGGSWGVIDLLLVVLGATMTWLMTLPPLGAPHEALSAMCATSVAITLTTILVTVDQVRTRARLLDTEAMNDLATSHLHKHYPEATQADADVAALLRS